MALSEPVAVYSAANDAEAHLFCSLLNEAGIEAHVSEDTSPMSGMVGEGHEHQVWVDRSNAEKVAELLRAYDRRLREERKAERTKAGGGDPVDAVCGECGEKTTFPAEMRGAVDNCPHCGSYMDIGGEAEDWDVGEPEPEPEPEPQ